MIFSLTGSAAFLLLGAYLPCLILFIFYAEHLWRLYKLAKREKSNSSPLFFAIWFVAIALIISWAMVLAIAFILVDRGVAVLSWEVLGLPVGWSLIMSVLNREIRR
jgi:hypothetical protein